jgi:hypothetical protein
MSWETHTQSAGWDLIAALSRDKSRLPPIINHLYDAIDNLKLAIDELETEEEST